MNAEGRNCGKVAMSQCSLERPVQDRRQQGGQLGGGLGLQALQRVHFRLHFSQTVLPFNGWKPKFVRENLGGLNSLPSITESFASGGNCFPKVRWLKISGKKLRPNLMIIAVERWILLRNESAIEFGRDPSVSSLECKEPAVNKLSRLDAPERCGAGRKTINGWLMK